MKKKTQKKKAARIQEPVLPDPEKSRKEPSIITDIPKWYRPLHRHRLRLELIQHFYNRYIDANREYNISTTEKEMLRYKIALKKLKLKELLSIEQIVPRKLRLDLIDRIRGLNRKKAHLITIINDNNTFDTFTINKYSRTFDRTGCRYFFDPNKAFYNPEFRIRHSFYYFNNPYPIQFQKTKLPDAHPDGRLLKSVLHFEYLTALANVVKVNSKLNFVLVFTIIIAVITILDFILRIREAGYLEGII